MKATFVFSLLLFIGSTLAAPSGSETRNSEGALTSAQQIDALERENEALRTQLSTLKSGHPGLTNQHILHFQLRNISIAGMLRDGKINEAIELLERDIPFFIKEFRSSHRFTSSDAWILHAIRDYYIRYNLSMSRDMFNDLPAPYPACNATNGIKIISSKRAEQDAAANP